MANFCGKEELSNYRKVKDLLSNAYAGKRRKLIGPKALQPKPGQPPKGRTVYLATAVKEDNRVSFGRYCRLVNNAVYSNGCNRSAVM